MAKKKAFITGLTGQDGSYLAEHLLEQGYEVHGIVRRNSIPENQSYRLDHIFDDIHTYYSDLLDESSISNLIRKIQPDEVYNLAAMSHVRISFDIPAFTLKTNSLGTLAILEAIKEYSSHSKFYQASSSEMFGNSIDADGYQRLSTPMHPVSPYGCSKLVSFNLTNVYRDAYNLHCCNGVLFNHESPRRGINFVTNKVVKTAVEIKKGYKNNLELGNLDSGRDWGHSWDYVRAMHLILNYPEARNWVVATGESKSVRHLCEYVFSSLGLNYLDYVVQNQKFIRPTELNCLRGDSSETKEKLNWTPKYNFETMLDEMIDFWLREIK
jgi:GDPmannose 4,6-dehydratase